MDQLATHPISLQYQVRTSKHGHREIERLLPLLGELQNAVIKHRRMLARARIPTKEILRLQNAGITDLRNHDPNFGSISRRLAVSVAKRVNDAYTRTFTVPGAGFPRTRPPHAFRTLEISEPAVNHVTFRKSGIAEIHVKGLPVLWFKTDHRISCIDQPRTIRITRHGGTLTATLVYQFPDPTPTRATYRSCRIDPGVKHRLTVVNNQARYRQFPRIDTSQHRKEMRRLRRRLQRCRDAALHDGHAHWVDHKRTDDKTKRRFPWHGKPSRTYLQVLSQLQNVEHKRIKTMQADEHRLTSEIVQDHALIAMEDTAIVNMTKSGKGTAKKPGRKVAQKRGLNREVLSQRWASISSKLGYKAHWYGRQFIRVPAAYTSQSCPSCGHVAAGNRPDQAAFKCQRCRLAFNADVIAAENIRLREVALAAGTGNPATPAPVNGRGPMGKKQRIRALQRPLLLFTKTRI